MLEYYIFEIGFADGEILNLSFSMGDEVEAYSHAVVAGLQEAAAGDTRLTSITRVNLAPISVQVSMN